MALEERIGNVCTGLNVETIMNGLKQCKYAENGTKDQVDTEPCSICRVITCSSTSHIITLNCGDTFAIPKFLDVITLFIYSTTTVVCVCTFQVLE